MEEKTRLLIALGAAAAVNCLPCGEHIMAAAQAAGISPEEMEQAWQVSQKVKLGADEVTQSWLRDQVAGGGGEVASCSCAAPKVAPSCPLPSETEGQGPGQAGAQSSCCC
jgi:hypothetical protein